MSRDQIDGLKVQFFTHGTQYYVSARFAVTAALAPVSGNLFHHAVEMLIKGALCEHLDESQRKRLGHDLIPLWGAFKSQVSDPKLDRFDRVIEELDRFEDIRYPAPIVAKEMLCEFSFDPIEPGVSGVYPDPKTPRYMLRVDELDALVEVIFQRARVNPRFFSNSLNVAARRYLDRYPGALCRGRPRVHGAEPQLGNVAAPRRGAPRGPQLRPVRLCSSALALTLGNARMHTITAVRPTALAPARHGHVFPSPDRDPPHARWRRPSDNLRSGVPSDGTLTNSPPRTETQQ